MANFGVALTPGAVQTIGGLGTTQKIFQSNIKNAAGVVQSPFVSGVTDFLLPIPGLNRFNGKKICVDIVGNVYVHGTTPTFQVQMLGSVLGVSNTIMAQSAAVTLTTNANYDWEIYAELFCSNAPAVAGGVGGAGAVSGFFEYFIGGTYAARAALTNNLPSVSMNSTPAYYLKVAGLFSVTDALDIASLTQFNAWTDE
jgi:hypothetical protein